MCLYLGGMRSSNWKFYWNGNCSRWAYSDFISCSKNMNYFIIHIQLLWALTAKHGRYEMPFPLNCIRRLNNKHLTLTAYGRPCVCKESPQESGGPWELIYERFRPWYIRLLLSTHTFANSCLRGDRPPWMYIMPSGLLLNSSTAGLSGGHATTWSRAQILAIAYSTL